MNNTRGIIEAVTLIQDELGPNVAWSLSACVHLIGPGTTAHPAQIQVFEKDTTSFTIAASTAVRRYKARAAGRSGA